MTQASPSPDRDRTEQALRMALAGAVGQVGCLTLVIISIALIAGLWLDNQLDTRPLFALVFILASVPVTLYLMFRVVLSVAPRIQLGAEPHPPSQKEEREGGRSPGDDP
jgi:hypothetical protein